MGNVYFTFLISDKLIHFQFAFDSSINAYLSLFFCIFSNEVRGGLGSLRIKYKIKRGRLSR